MPDTTILLDEAVQFAVAAGLPCEGWMMQSAHDGYVAWLYVIDEVGTMVSLFEEVTAFPKASLAAQWCHAQVAGLANGGGDGNN